MHQSWGGMGSGPASLGEVWALKGRLHPEVPSMGRTSFTWVLGGSQMWRLDKMTLGTHSW